MSTYRTGNHWGVTIVRESNERHADDCYCTGDYVEPVCTAMREGPPDAQLVAVVVNGDQALAERICALLNGGEGVPAEVEPISAQAIADVLAIVDAPYRPGLDVRLLDDEPADSCTCTIAGLDRACIVHQGRRARGPKPPNPPGCICDGSGRTCPRHGAVL